MQELTGLASVKGLYSCNPAVVVCLACATDGSWNKKNQFHVVVLSTLTTRQSKKKNASHYKSMHNVAE